MEIVTPIASSLAQSVAVTRQQSTDKVQQVRQAQVQRKDVSATKDTFEHQVESAEELRPIHDEQRQPPQQRQKKPKRSPARDNSAAVVDDAPRIDVVA